MCRLLGVVSSEATDFRFHLRAAPRSLATLSPHHPDGWGVAVLDEAGVWNVTKHPECAHVDERFDEAAAARGRMLIAHVRKRTVGSIATENTHPFHRGEWVFAHNGTIEDTTWLESHTSFERRGEIVGSTDSERLFAYLLTALDAHPEDVGVATLADAVVHAMRELLAHVSCSANFLLARGAVMFAHRFGRELCLLERGSHDRVRPSRRSHETAAVIDTPWSQRRHAIFVASERLTDEEWVDVAEGSLVAIEARGVPFWELAGSTR